ncbi:Mediator of RNA polymerase II transcription subunit 7 [Lithohypha guttulata]|nr:Mediator of RNA polymerase II transcription subunit 7 [Lithohypha guttulata]
MDNQQAQPAQQGQQPLQPEPIFDARFPAPPPFWRSFTTQNLAQLEEHESQADFDPADLPYSLAVLRPPPRPTENTKEYHVYGTTYTISPAPTLPFEDDQLIDFTSLTTASTQRVHARKLWQLTKSLVLNYLELSTIMAVDPKSYHEKVKDIEVLMTNVNGVINTLRPHQAREGLKIMLTNRLDAGREEMEKCDKLKAEIEEFLSGVGKFEDEDREGERIEESQDRAKAEVNGVHRVNGVYAQVNGTNSPEVERLRRAWEDLDDLDDD